ATGQPRSPAPAPGRAARAAPTPAHPRPRRAPGTPAGGWRRSWGKTLSPVAADDPSDPLPPLLDLGLGAQLGRPVVVRVQHHVGGVLLLGDAERLVVAVG